MGSSFPLLKNPPRVDVERPEVAVIPPSHSGASFASSPLRRRKKKSERGSRKKKRVKLEKETHAFSISTRIAASSTGGLPKTDMILFLDPASMVGRTLVRV